MPKKSLAPLKVAPLQYVVAEPITDPAEQAALDKIRKREKQIYQKARVRPRFVQNRCYAARGWDREVRRFCADNGLAYQGFSLLTANRDALARPELTRIATRHGRPAAQVVFRFALDVGMIPLTGTTDPDHMRLDWGAFDFRLGPEELKEIEGLAGP